MKEFIGKLPTWALTIVLAVFGAASSVFTMQSAASYLDAMGYGTVTLVIAILFSGVLYAFFMRLAARLVYGLGDRLFFRAMSAVPDYNLRRLPVPYNDYLRVVLFWLCVAMFFGAIFNSVLIFVYPVGIYLWRCLSRLAIILCLALAYRHIDKYYVPTWQSGKCFLCLMVPAAVVFVLFEVIL